VAGVTSFFRFTQVNKFEVILCSGSDVTQNL
jgi:hypothetical protein